MFEFKYLIFHNLFSHIRSTFYFCLWKIFCVLMFIVIKSLYYYSHCSNLVKKAQQKMTVLMYGVLRRLYCHLHASHFLPTPVLIHCSWGPVCQYSPFTLFMESKSLWPPGARLKMSLRITCLFQCSLLFIRMFLQLSLGYSRSLNLLLGEGSKSSQYHILT